MKNTSVSIQMKNIVAIRNKTEDIIFLKQLGTISPGHFPLGLRHAENPTLHIGDINLAESWVDGVLVERVEFTPALKIPPSVALQPAGCITEGGNGEQE